MRFGKSYVHSGDCIVKWHQCPPCLQKGYFKGARSSNRKEKRAGNEFLSLTIQHREQPGKCKNNVNSRNSKGKSSLLIFFLKDNDNYYMFSSFKKEEFEIWNHSLVQKYWI
jgi:hypothetical protein